MSDVQEQPIHRHGFEQVRDVLLEKFPVRRVHAQPPVETGVERTAPVPRARGGHLQPFRMLPGGVMVPLHRHVNRNPDVARVAGVDLLFQQIARQVRMAPLGKPAGLMIEVPVVTPPETGHRIDTGPRQHGGDRREKNDAVASVGHEHQEGQGPQNDEKVHYLSP